MCGIVGYVGKRDAVGILLDGLGRLEYRGYDSAGLVVQTDSTLVVRRSVGKIARLRQVIEGATVAGKTALGHTRWATHGRPSDANAHPHVDCSGRVAVVHNGILENYLELKMKLEAEGHNFRSETDTEVMAHLVERELPRSGDLASAVKAALRQVRGAYAFCVLSADALGLIVAAKRGGGAVVVGLGEGEVFIASDIPAVIPHTRQVVILEDDEVAEIGCEGLAISTLEGVAV